MPDLEALAEVFGQYPGVEAVYLFGSQATGQAHPGSDLDLAVVPADGVPGPERLNILADLARAGFDDVDLIVLDGNDLVLSFEAVRPNQMVYQSAAFDRGAYYSKVVRMYLDFLPFLEVQRRAYRRRLSHGQT
ncbi:MAG: nucleotidyltransferase domain-containing protein [Anaerolineae bacterium]